MNRVEKLRQWIVENGYEDWQTFDCRNIAGDEMETIYCEDGIMVDVCHDWEYLEIFGLTKKQYNSLSDVLEIC